jgi:hypothetical protein
MEQIRITETLAPQEMPDTIEETRSPNRTKKTRSGEARKLVMRACALWVIEPLAASGITFEQWFVAGCFLSAIGINRANAVADLKPAIPSAHVWYWEAYFSGSLSNRIYYFFRKHVEGKIVVAVAEWPWTIQDGELIARKEKP